MTQDAHEDRGGSGPDVVSQGVVTMTGRAEHEIHHGRFLSSKDPELEWGWGSPAGRLRAIRRAKLIAAGAALGPNMQVLEIGCGTGLFTEMFASTKASIVAVDISPDLLRRARERNLPEATVRFVEKRFEECDVDGPFDAIIGSSVLHHLELEKALQRIRLLLKPGGVLSFAEPNLMNPQVFLERRFRSAFPHISPDETAFGRWGLKQELRNAGFEAIEIRPFDWLHPAVPRPFIGLISTAGRAFERIPFFREWSGSLYIRAIRPMTRSQ